MDLPSISGLQVVVPGALFAVPRFLQPQVARCTHALLMRELGSFIKPTSSGARSVARFGKSYTYRGRPLPVFAYTPVLQALQDFVAQSLGIQLNAAVVNLYSTGANALEPHSDTMAIPQLGKEPVIPCVSFGASRPFVLAPLKKALAPTVITVNEGDLVVMHGSSQSHFRHSLPAVNDLLLPRLSVTFRYHQE